MVINNFVNSYSITTRLLPALLILGPIYLVTVAFLGDSLGAYWVALFLLSLPACYIMMNAIRSRGKCYERLLSSTGLLRRVLHDEAVKYDAVVPRLLVQKLKVHYGKDAAERLMEITRDEKRFPVVQSELRAYDFIRNCLGIKSRLVVMYLGLIFFLLMAMFALTEADGRWLMPGVSGVDLAVCAIILTLVLIIILRYITKPALWKVERAYVKAVCQAGLQLIEER